MSQTLKTAIAVVGIDIGKNSFHVVGLDQRGAIVLRQEVVRGQVTVCQYAAVPNRDGGVRWCALSQSEAEGAWSRRAADVRQVCGPLFEGQKNDFRDAEAIGEAVQRPTMTFVATKTADQLDLQALHRVREGEVLGLLENWRGASFADVNQQTGFGEPGKGAPHGNENTGFAAHT
jgi:transposase